MASMRERSRRTVRSAAAVGVMVVGLAVVGCESRDPNRPLSDAEGEALLKSIRAHPPRPDDLTPAEKKYLKGYLAR